MVPKYINKKIGQCTIIADVKTIDVLCGLGAKHYISGTRP